MKKIIKLECPTCKSKKVGKTAPEYLDTMRDYFCYECSTDFSITK
jgi:transposase-like protein